MDATACLKTTPSTEWVCGWRSISSRAFALELLDKAVEGKCVEAGLAQEIKTALDSGWFNADGDRAAARTS